jgi:hypothetical protein
MQGMRERPTKLTKYLRSDSTFELIQQNLRIQQQDMDMDNSGGVTLQELQAWYHVRHKVTIHIALLVRLAHHGMRHRAQRKEDY